MSRVHLTASGPLRRAPPRRFAARAERLDHAAEARRTALAVLTCAVLVAAGLALRVAFGPL